MIARPLYPLLIRPCPREVFPGTDFRVCKDLSLVSPIPCFGPAAHSLPLLLSPFESGSGQRLRGKRRNERDGESRAPSLPAPSASAVWAPRPSATFKELFKRAPSVRLLPFRIFSREIDGDGVRAGMPFRRFSPSPPPPPPRTDSRARNCRVS